LKKLCCYFLIGTGGTAGAAGAAVAGSIEGTGGGAGKGCGGGIGGSSRYKLLGFFIFVIIQRMPFNTAVNFPDN
jgi:hypothetical protein